MEQYGYEELAIHSDKSTGLRAMICIHNTTLGPACGGTRMWPFVNEEEAILDVLRLARAMTYKSSLAGLNFGGGKALIIGDPSKDKSEDLFRAHGRFVDTMSGRYITTEDVGTVVEDVVHMRKETQHASGLPKNLGGLGGAEVITGFGVYQGAKACMKEITGSDSLSGKTIAIQGFGKVAYHLAKHLQGEGAHIITTDINKLRTTEAIKIGAKIVAPDDIYDVECDIFSPCALGGTLNSNTIPRIKASIVAGAANNQLQENHHCEELQNAGILYAPDYAINPGGVITVACEIEGKSRNDAITQTSKVYDTLLEIFAKAKKEGITTAISADRLAQDRINTAAKLKNAPNTND